MPNTKANFKNLDILINNLVSSAKLNLFKLNNLFHLYILNLINYRPIILTTLKNFRQQSNL